MTVTYAHEGKLYINLTNRCSNACTFCVRTANDGYYSENSLWLEREPTAQEVIDSVCRHDLSRYSEIVFCGYGEPTYRLDVLLEVCRVLKDMSTLPIRVNTNGHADLIWGRDTTPELAGLVDILSISLNAANAQDYQRVCHSRFGEAAYGALLTFAEHAKRYVPAVLLSVVRTTIPDRDIEICQKTADRLGVTLRVRELV